MSTINMFIGIITNTVDETNFLAVWGFFFQGKTYNI